MRTTRSACAASALVEPACSVAEAPRQRIVGHDAEADLVGDQHGRAAACGPAPPAAVAVRASMSALRQHQVGQPQRQAIDQHRLRRQARPRARRRDRAAPRRVASRQRAVPMRGDALGHLVVDRLRRRDVDPGRRIASRSATRHAALARARAAEHEGQSPARRVRQASASGRPLRPGAKRSEQQPAAARRARTQNTSLVTASPRRRSCGCRAFAGSADLVMLQPAAARRCDMRRRPAARSGRERRDEPRASRPASAMPPCEVSIISDPASA